MTAIQAGYLNFTGKPFCSFYKFTCTTEFILFYVQSSSSMQTRFAAKQACLCVYFFHKQFLSSNPFFLLYFRRSQIPFLQTPSLTQTLASTHAKEGLHSFMLPSFLRSFPHCPFSAEKEAVSFYGIHSHHLFSLVGVLFLLFLLSPMVERQGW